MVTELVRLSTLDPLLSEERRFVAAHDAGLEHSILGGQLDTAAVWLHGKLLSSLEEGQQADRARIVKELSNVSKFVGGAKHRVDRAMPWGGAPMQSLALTHHFSGHSRGHSMYPTAPAWTNPGVPGQYGPSRGRGGGRGVGARKQPVCNKCKDTGKRGGDILHSYRVCPLVKCNRCHQLGYISKNCTNPWGSLCAHCLLRKPGGITVGSVLSPPPLLAFIFPCTSRFNFPLFSCVCRTSLLRYNIVSMFQFIFFFIFLSSGPRNQRATPVRVPQ